MEFCLVMSGNDEQRFGCFNICGMKLSTGIIDLSRIRNGVVHKSVAREMRKRFKNVIFQCGLFNNCNTVREVV